MYSMLRKKKIVCSAAILVACAVGDKNSMPKRDVDLAAAVCDNLAHALIGLFTWLAVLALETSNPASKIYPQILLCGLCSSIIDLDHFLSAKSLNLKDAVSLKSRPIFHCTTSALFFCSIILWSAVKLQFVWLYRFGWILVAAVLSHHIRDSTRRGLWLWPFGSTKPLPYVAYLALEAILPDIIYLLFKFFDWTSDQRTPESNIPMTV